MNATELFLREHGAGHHSAVAPHPLNLDPLLKRFSDREFRVMPQGLNSLAWLFWHMTRVEDGCVACALGGREQLLDEGWSKRLGVASRDVGTGMTKAEVQELSAQIDLEGLWAYREAVGRRTRTLVAELPVSHWAASFTEGDLRRAAGEGVLAGDEAWLIGTTRDSLLFWWGLHHTHVHVGQVLMLRNLVSGGK